MFVHIFIFNPFRGRTQLDEFFCPPSKNINFYHKIQCLFEVIGSCVGQTAQLPASYH